MTEKERKEKEYDFLINGMPNKNDFFDNQCLILARKTEQEKTGKEG